LKRTCKGGEVTVFKIIQKKNLLELRKMEKKGGRKFNQSLSDSFVLWMDDELRLPVLNAFSHDDIEVRAVCQLNKEGTLGVVDMPIEYYNNLQEVVVENE
jgi:hypothetical protein